MSAPDLEHGAPDLQEVSFFELGPLSDPDGVHPGAIGGSQILDPQVAVESEQSGVQARRKGVVVDGHATARGSAHRDFVTDVIDATGLVFGSDHVQAQETSALAVDYWVDVLASATLALERADLHPYGADDPHEEEPDQEDDAESEHP